VWSVNDQGEIVERQEALRAQTPMSWKMPRARVGRAFAWMAAIPPSILRGLWLHMRPNDPRSNEFGASGFFHATS
jgi:hypothetical protein